MTASKRAKPACWNGKEPRGQSAAGGVQARDCCTYAGWCLWSRAGRQRWKLNCPISESFEASLIARCKPRLGIAGRWSGAEVPASDVICNDALQGAPVINIKPLWSTIGNQWADRCVWKANAAIFRGHVRSSVCSEGCERRKMLEFQSSRNKPNYT